MQQEERERGAYTYMADVSTSNLLSVMCCVHLAYVERRKHVAGGPIWA